MAEAAFGLALQNFTPSSAEPEFERLAAYARRGEELGFRSMWAWDHVLLGSKKPFPFLESLTTLAGLAAVTTRVQLGTGVLVLPIRNPVLLAKVSATVDRISGGRLVLGVAAGWYEREFEAMGVPFKGRGATFERNLDVLYRFWTEEAVTGEADRMVFNRAVMLPKPVQRPRPAVLVGGYVDRVLRRAATKADGWLAYFYPAESFARSWGKVRRFAEEGGRDPDELTNLSQLVICVDDLWERADRRARAFMDAYFDTPPWSEATQEHAVRGTPDQCAEQLARHLEAGVQSVCLVPCDYAPEQVEAVAADVLPKLSASFRLAARSTA